MAERAVQVTHPEKILFPDDGLTKGDLVDYYRAVASFMVRYLRDRAANVERFPNGIGEAGFFQQAVPGKPPSWMASVEVPKAGGRVRHVVVRNAATLVYLANQNCITVHSWLSRLGRLDIPDQAIFDVDPPKGTEATAPEVARLLRDELRDIGLVPFLKTTGSRGYHVVVPLTPAAPFDTVREWAAGVANRLAERHPKRITTAPRKQARGTRIYIDTLRNAYGHTAVAPFSVRARRGAPVATPIAWEELDEPGMHSARFTITNVLPRLDAGVDPWRDFRRRAKALTNYI